MRKINAALGVLALVAMMLGSPVSATPVQVTASWSAPTTGSPVHHYRLELKTDNGAYVVAGMPITTSVVLTLESGHTYVVRVAGIDALDRQGVWSADSDPYIPDLGVPGACGKPIVVQQ